MPKIPTPKAKPKTGDSELRLLALNLAVLRQDDPSETSAARTATIVARAEAFLAFLKGEAKTP